MSIRTKLILALVGLIVIYIIYGAIKKAINYRKYKDPKRRVPDQEQNRLELIAEDIYTQVEVTPPDNEKRQNAVEQLRALDDSALVYLAGYYKGYLSGGDKLSKVLDSEWTLHDVDDIIARLKSLRE